MEGYQKERSKVKRAIEVLDSELLVELASEGLLALCCGLGLRQSGR